MGCVQFSVFTISLTILVRDWLIHPTPENCKGHHEHRKLNATHFLLLLISCVVNYNRLFCTQKAGVKCLY